MKVAGYKTLEDEVTSEAIWEVFKETVKDRFKNRKFPLCLKAVNSNWRGQTGYAVVHNVDEMLNKVMSFGNDWVELHSTRGGALEFRTASHDVPTGFTIYVNRKRDCKGV